MAPRKSKTNSTETKAQSGIDQKFFANTVTGFLESFKEDCVTSLLTSGFSREEVQKINQTLEAQLEINKSKAYNYASNL